MFWSTDLFGEMEQLRRQMDALMSGLSSRGGTASTFPLLNAYEDPSSIMVTAELPGCTRETVSITFADGVLTISGKQEPVAASKNMAVIRKERSVGKFEKTLQIPMKIDAGAIKAAFTNGILTIVLPKAEEAKPKTIAIEAK